MNCCCITDPLGAAQKDSGERKASSVQNLRGTLHYPLRVRKEWAMDSWIGIPGYRMDRQKNLHGQSAACK